MFQGSTQLCLRSKGMLIGSRCGAGTDSGISGKWFQPSKPPAAAVCTRNVRKFFTAVQAEDQMFRRPRLWFPKPGWILYHLCRPLPPSTEFNSCTVFVLLMRGFAAMRQCKTRHRWSAFKDSSTSRRVAGRPVPHCSTVFAAVICTLEFKVHSRLFLSQIFFFLFGNSHSAVPY